MNGTTSLKFIDAKQAKDIYHYKNIKGNCIEQTRPSGITIQVVWPVPEAAGTVFSTTDDGCCDTRNM